MAMESHKGQTATLYVNIFPISSSDSVSTIGGRAFIHRIPHIAYIKIAYVISFLAWIYLKLSLFMKFPPRLLDGPIWCGGLHPMNILIEAK